MSKKLDIPQHTRDEQFAASDPKRFAWVSANAGSGKTHVLTQRVIRLMLDGNAPDKILCLTFTKAAAANMKNRVFGTLAEWTMIPDDALGEKIYESTGVHPSNDILRRARQLFAEALDTPGGLKIQTIHAFCESLLHQFPLEANVSGHFEVIQETTQATMLAEARAHVLGSNEDQEITEAFAALVPLASDSVIDTAISEVISNRHAFQEWILNTELGAGSVDLAADTLYPVFGITREDTEENVQEAFLQTLFPDTIYFQAVMQSAEASGKKTDTNLSDRLKLWLNGHDINARFAVWRDICFTQKGEFRTERSIATGEVKKHYPDLVERIHNVGEALVASLDKIRAIQTIEKSRHLFKIAYAVLERYERMKRAAGQIDYDDQIWKTVSLLKRPDIRDWIRYRLDQGIDHVLVDEAQDTSPAQWEIINAVTEDFYAGDSSSRKERTVFVVGDEKQSIYSFQGADPREFEDQRRRLDKHVSAIGKTLKKARLDLSFRSTKDVLHAVDFVFENQENARGLTQSGTAPPHDAVRANDPGEVQVWPLFVRERNEKTENWLAPIDHEGEEDPAALLANRIADTIEQWVGTPLPGTGEPLKFGDILILVRKRDRFITALTRTLKDRGLSVAGADRLRLLEHIAVEDLLAIGRFVLLQDDDLNLAAVLKSSVVGLTDKELFDIAHDRGALSLFDQLKHCAYIEDHPARKPAAHAFVCLKEILKQANKRPIFEFYAWLFGAYGVRKKLLSQLGMEAEDVLDAFMDEITGYVRDGGTGLEGFISQLTKANPEIKRELELDRDEVRILTVHASKGLEARAVFLVDSCGSAWISNHRPKVVELNNEQSQKHFTWVPTSMDQTQATLSVMQQAEADANAEYRRLLYVGMTRAADRLVVCGYRGIRDPKHDFWHRMVERALMPSATEIGESDGGGIRWVKEERPPLPVVSDGSSDKDKQSDHTLPEWLLTPVKADPPLPKPLTPSGAYALIDETLKENRQPAFEAAEEGSTFALQVGNTVHRLLEVLPDLPIEQRMQAAENHVAKQGNEWPDSICSKILSNIETILTQQPFRDIFDANGRAEVPTIGSIETKSGLRFLSGQIDRLIVSEELVTIIDYKTNRLIPDDVSDYPAEYVTQLALYRHLMEKVYPNHKVECALLWTSGPKLITLPSDLLTTALETVKNG